MNISGYILESIAAKMRLLEKPEHIKTIEFMGRTMIQALHSGNKIIIAGNGGSAADAQHLAAELAGKFIHPRKGLSAVALTTNSSIITAIGNDFGFEHIFSRQLDGLAGPQDVVIGISTSGNSQNIIQMIKKAKDIGCITFGLLGNDGGATTSLCDMACIVPSHNTQHIQEAHTMIVHILCALVDDAFKSNQ